MIKLRGRDVLAPQDEVAVAVVLDLVDELEGVAVVPGGRGVVDHAVGDEVAGPGDRDLRLANDPRDAHGGVSPW
jgi:hypothetical protein